MRARPPRNILHKLSGESNPRIEQSASVPFVRLVHRVLVDKAFIGVLHQKIDREVNEVQRLAGQQLVLFVRLLQIMQQAGQPLLQREDRSLVVGGMNGTDQIGDLSDEPVKTLLRKEALGLLYPELLQLFRLLRPFPFLLDDSVQLIYLVVNQRLGLLAFSGEQLLVQIGLMLKRLDDPFDGQANPPFL